MNTITETRQIPVKGEYDVVVAGAGVAGLAAALVAKRAGLKVLLLEKSMMLGGLATLGHINFFVPMCDGHGRQITKGMVDEFIDLSVRYGYDIRPDIWKNGEPGPAADGSPVERYHVRYSACMFALTMTEVIHEAGIDLSFDTIASEPVMKDGHCEGLIIENKSGRSFIRAGVVVDTTGDADILYRAGVPTVQGRNFHSYFAYMMDLEHCREAVEKGNIRIAEAGASGGYANLYGGNHPENIPFYTGTSGEDVNRYLIDNQIEMLRKLKGDDKNKRQVISLPGMCQFRTTRRIDGDYTLTMDDQYKHFEDSVSAVNDFDHRDFLFEVPYRTLVRTGFDNLITAGRSAAGDGYAWDILRVIPPAILTGQAAGCAAVQALAENTGIDRIDVKKLQKTLADQNVIIHFDDAWVSANGSGEAVDVGHI